MSSTEKSAGLFQEAKSAWPKLDAFERFEYMVSLIIMFIITVVVMVALIRLGKNVFELLVVHTLDPLEFSVFQKIFGNMLTLYIAMEFRHSIENVLHQRGHIIHVRTILLIAMLAVARKFIVLDKTATPETMAALALILLSLGAVYWILKKPKGGEQCHES